MSSWIKNYPRMVSKNDLRGKKLRVLEDSPPTVSNVSGMQNLIVLSMDEGKKFKCLVTEKDLQAIIDLAEAGKPFTFDKTEPYANVEEWKY